MVCEWVNFTFLKKKKKKRKPETLPKRSSPDSGKRARISRTYVRRAAAESAASELARDKMKQELLDREGLDPLDEAIRMFQDLKLESRVEQQLRKKELDHYKKWVTEFRPTGWDQVDEEWIKVWTPFPCKAAAIAFFDVFILPRVHMFRKYNNFNNHCIQRHHKLDSDDDDDTVRSLFPLFDSETITHKELKELQLELFGSETDEAEELEREGE